MESSGAHFIKSTELEAWKFGLYFQGRGLPLKALGSREEEFSRGEYYGFPYKMAEEEIRESETNIIQEGDD